MSAHLEAGSRLAGYRLLRLIGRGGTGLVYEAEHVVLHRSAAVKTLLPGLVDDPEFRERLLRESRTVAALDHPAVIPIYDAGEVDGVIFVAMRLVRGSDFREHLTRSGPLGVEATLAVLEQVAGALDAAHREGLVHRDVKPANVLLEEATERVYLTDFGIAKQAHAPGLTRTGFFVGTVDYAAPEQIRGDAVGPRADVYAFGCMLYECLAGRVPYPYETLPEVARAHLFDPPPRFPAELGLPPALEDVVARALAKDEGDRYGDCRTLLADARAATRGAEPAAESAPAPPPAPPRPPTHPLPPETTALVGRDAERDRLAGLLLQPDVQLVTVTGLAGAGKTRLALAAAHAAAAAFDEVAFVDLSVVVEPDAVPAALAAAVGAEEGGGDVVEDVLAWRLADTRLLLVADSFERVRPAAAVLERLTAMCPGLTVLATSQVPLRLKQEHRFPVEPLPVPGAAAVPAEEPAVRLFAERARAVKPDFELTDENAGTVAAICARLDGLPLAIELAASRVTMLSPAAILGRLEERFELLVESGTTEPPRHRALRQAIDWTHDLLGPDDRALLARLSVFAGSWSLEAADAVCGTPGSPRIGELLNACATLVDASLVRQRDGHDGEPRFEMLETIRYYAGDRLRERDEADVVHERHAQRFAALAATAEQELHGSGQLVWLARLDEEAGNLWSALQWACEHGRTELALRMSGDLARYWSLRGRGVEARRWLEPVLADTADVPPDAVARGAFAAGYAALGHGDFAVAERYFEQSAEAAATAADARAEAAALAQLAWVAAATGRDERAREQAVRALGLSEQSPHPVTESGAHSVLAAVARSDGDDAETVRLLERSLELRRDLGDRRLIAVSVLELARAELERGDRVRASALVGEALEHARRVEDGWTTSLALSTQGALAALAGDDEAAERAFLDAFRLARHRGDKRVCGECLLGLAVTACDTGDARRSARLLGAARELRRAAGAGRSPVETVLEHPLSRRLRAELGSLYEADVQAGSRAPVDELLEPAARD